jgi:hypothetical protein
VRDDFPTVQWQAGDVWRALHSFRLPVNLASGDYRWQLTLCDEQCRAPVADLGALTITAPDRLFTPPPSAIPLNAQFNDLATLLGATLSPSPLPPGSPTLTATLVWRAETETPTSYRVFVHLVDEAGQIVAQSDGEPAGWTRPTTGWLPGEFVPDVHTLNLTTVPPGVYQLNIGLYDPVGGGRVPLPDGATAVTIPNITVP